MTTSTREAWLLEALESLRPIVREAGAIVPSVAVSMGFPRHRGRSSVRLGECWDGALASDGRPAIFVSPILDDPVRILDVLLHELIHAAVGSQHGHRGRFVKIARACGLEGKPSATTAGKRLKARLNALADSLGPLPHAALNPITVPGTGSRLRLYECACPVKVRVASDRFDATCNACGDYFQRPR